MNKLVVIVTELGLAILLAPPAQSDTVAGVRKILQSLYDQSSAALARKDITGATAIDDPNYVFVDDQGKPHTLVESRQRAQQRLQRPQTVQMTAKIDTVTLHDKNATVNVHQHLMTKWVNPKTHHTFVTDQWTTNTDLWVKQGKTWRRTHGQTHSIRVYLNGQQVYKH